MISICIPTWEQYGNGHAFLEYNLISILRQTYDNFNVIISDQSLDDKVEKVCNKYKDRLNLIYIKNENDLGNGPANTNNAILNADGDIIKILFQDDFFFTHDALEKIAKVFENGKCNWAVSGCNHTQYDAKYFYNYMIPKWNDNIIDGVNTISSPSVLAFRKSSNCLFDEKLIMMMDCEIYFRLYLKYGAPEIIQDTLITNRIHKDQISVQYNDDYMHKEIKYIKEKHKLP